MKTILSDCDGVLLDWETHFHEWMRSKGYDKLGANTYDIHEQYPGMVKAEAKAHIREFNESAWMCCLEPLRDARSGVAQLTEAGYQFTVITSLSKDPYAKKLRQQNLDTVFGKTPWQDLVCLDTGADKDHELEPYRDSGLWWIEDKPENCETGLKVGLKPILISHPHNMDYHNPGVTRAADWAEVVKIIKEN